MRSGKQTFQSFWFGAPLSPYEALCMRSFIDRGHRFELYTYDEHFVVPKGVKLRDAGEILHPREQKRLTASAEATVRASFSDLFRFKLLAERGGWWVDTDVLCLSDEIPSFERFCAFEDPTLVNTAILYASPGDELITRCLDVAQRHRGGVQWGDLGPLLLTRLVNELQLIDLVQPKATCYPLHGREALDVLKPEATENVIERTHASLFLHLWNEVLRRERINKRLLPPQGSFLRTLADQHPVQGWEGEYTLAHFREALAWHDEVKQVKEELGATRSHAEELEMNLRLTLNSTSWKISAPVRALARLRRS